MTKRRNNKKKEGKKKADGTLKKPLALHSVNHQRQRAKRKIKGKERRSAV